MNALDYDSKKAGKRWVSYFDRLGFGDYCKNNSLIEVFLDTCYWLARAKEEMEYEADVEFAWFSDSILFYSADDSRSSFQAVAGVSEILLRRDP